MWGHNETSGVRAQRSSIRALVAGTMGAVTALGLTACAPSSNADEIAAVQLHPTGSDGAWLKDAYANGTTDRYVTQGTLCALQDDIAVEWIIDEREVVATNILDNTVVWQLDSAMCASGISTPSNNAGILLTSWTTDADGTETGVQEVVNPITGESVSASPWDFIGAQQVIGTADDITIFQLPGQYAGVRDNEIVWTASASNTAWTVVLDSGVIATNDLAQSTITLIDGTTGSEIISLKPDANQFAWATDGVLVLEDDDPSTPAMWHPEESEYRLQDLTGATVSRIPATTNVDPAPGWRNGVTVTLDDYMQGASVYAVTQDGTPALFDDNLGETHTQTGVLSEQLNPDYASGVSADGAVLLFTTPGHDPQLVVDGTITELTTSEKYLSAYVRDGYIVLGTGGSAGTEILIPNAG